MIRVLKFGTAVFVPLVTIAFLISEHRGFWDRYFQLTDVLEVARKFESSYTDEAGAPVRPEDAAWEPLLTLIGRYSTAKLPTEREPRVFARSVAVTSAKIEPEPGKIVAEWTAPSTPIFLVYVEWPGNQVGPSDYAVVGTIGDIRGWVDRYRADFHFFTRDVFILASSIVLGALIWVAEHRRKPA